MIQKLRRKFIVILMSVVAVILLAVFISMLLSTAGNARRMSENILRQALVMQPSPQGFRPPQGIDGRSPASEAPPYARMSVLVAEFSENGEISFLSNQLHFIEEDDAMSAVQAAMQMGGSTGTLSDFGLRWIKSEDGNRVALVDISMEQEMLRNLIVNSLMIGGAALVAFFFISIILSRWAVRPVERAWEQQKQFIADASHELKTPLTVILSNADMLCADQAFADDKKMRRMEHIQAEAIRMKQLVEDMLSLAKSDSAPETAVFSQIDFSYLITNILLIYEPIVFDEKKKLTYELQNSLAVMGDSERLKQLIHILLDNARKYCPQEGNIRIDLTANERGHLLLTVFNEGEPIPQDELEKIFLRFYRRDQSRNEHESFGLGLSIAHSIVKDHGGTIWAESKKEAGNTFFVSLPLVKS